MPEINFFWDPISDNIRQERDETGEVTAEYTTEPGLYGNLISESRGGLESQFHFSPQGSTLALTDDNQQVTETFSYDALGADIAPAPAAPAPFRYIGQKGYYWNSGSNDYSVRRRSYLPVQGRWNSADPLLSILDAISLEVPLNRYIYANNIYTGFVDPSGLKPPNHHWFPQFGGTGLARAKAICPGFNIDEFTTPLRNSVTDSPHWWVHHGYLGPNGYVNAADAIYQQIESRKPPSCCLFLLSMKVLMIRTWNALKTKFPNDPLLVGTFPPLNPWKGLARNTGPDFDVEIASACSGAIAAILARNCQTEYDNCRLEADTAYAQCKKDGGRFCWLTYQFGKLACSESEKICIEIFTNTIATKCVKEHPVLSIIVVAGVVLILVQPEFGPVLIPVALPALPGLQPAFGF